MKLLYILSEYLPESGGGIISHYARILPGLAARGHEVSVVLTSKDKLDHPDYEIDGVRVRPLKAKFLKRYANGFGRWVGLDLFYYLLPVAWAAWAQAQENFDYDLVEATDWALLFLPWVATGKRAPVVVSLHGSCGQVDWFGKGEPRLLDGDLVRMVEAAALRGADVVHANSRVNAKFWGEKTGLGIRVIPPARSEPEDGVTTKDTKRPERGEKHGAGSGEHEERSIEPRFSRMGTDGQQGDTQETCADAAFSNSFTSELARDCENTSPTRSASGPALAAEPPIKESGGQRAEEKADSGKLPATSYPLLATKPRAQALDSRPSTLDSPGLVVGRLQNWKGAEVLCKALRLVPEVEIEWVGGDTDWGSSGQMASEYLAVNYPDVFGKRLRWLGRLDREHVVEKMQLAGFLVVPSLWDVFNLTAAEGMEAGLPVICSKAAGAEMLIQHGHSGFLFNPAKPEELAEVIKNVAGMSSSERMDMGKMAQESVKRHLDYQMVLNHLEESYGDAVKNETQSRHDAWLPALLAPGGEQDNKPRLNLAHRAIRKVGKILADV